MVYTGSYVPKLLLLSSPKIYITKIGLSYEHLKYGIHKLFPTHSLFMSLFCFGLSASRSCGDAYGTLAFVPMVCSPIWLGTVLYCY